MTVETVTSRTAAPLYGSRSGRPGGSGGPADDGEPALADVYALRAHRAPAPLRQSGEAKVAEQPARLELVEALTGQRRAPAPATALAGGTQRADAAAQHVGGEIRHEGLFAASAADSCNSTAKLAK